MGRVLGVDYGRARIGLAYSDPGKFLASPLDVIRRLKKAELTFEEIQKKITSRAPFELIVVGLPLLLTGVEGEMALEAKAFGEELSRFLSIPVLFWDERLSSAQADRMLKEHSLSRKKRASLSDSAAATLILQNYLDFGSHQKR